MREDTRTMHTEVDVANPQRVLLPGLYADAELALDRKDDVPTVPVQALNHEGDKTTVFVVNGMANWRNEMCSLDCRPRAMPKLFPE